MPQFVIVDTRTISGLGTIRLPTDQGTLDIRQLWVFLTLLRRPTSEYKNLNWFPPKSKYAFLTFRRAGAVIYHECMEFPTQAFFTYPDPGGQALVATQCAYKGTLQTFFNLGNALSLPSISVNNDIKDYTRFTPEWDEVVINCFADTAIVAELIRYDYENCGTDSGLPQGTVVGSFPPAEVPAGSPVSVSPPYDVNDSTEPYDPNPLDATPTPTLSNCVIQYDYTDLFNSAFSGTFTKTALGVIAPITLGAVEYSDFTGSPNNTPKESRVEIFEANGDDFLFLVVDNTISGHTIENLQVLSCTPAPE